MRHRRRFIIHRNGVNRKYRRMFFILANILLFLGALLLVSSFFYLLIHLDKSDLLINKVIPIVVAGIGLLIVYQLIDRGRHHRLHR